MPERSQSTTPFKEGQQSNAKGKDAPKVKVQSDVSTSHFGPGHDPLMQSLSNGMPDLPNRYHMGNIVAEIHPKGVSYEPRGEFGSIKGKQSEPATNMKSHTSKPGESALGKTMNRVGQKSGYPASARKSGGGGKRV